jgi:predicted trehalose synthase
MTEWRAAGSVTAELHAALVDAFALLSGGAEDLAGWRAEAEAALEVAGRDDAELSAVAPDVRARLGALEHLAPPPVTRIHGDLHVAQLLRTAGAPLVIDFEGDPIRPLAARRRLSTPLWDVPDAWIEAATAAALDAYCAQSPVTVDRQLVMVLELAKECMEFVYALRYVPEWLYAPRAGLRRLLEAA